MSTNKSFYKNLPMVCCSDFSVSIIVMTLIDFQWLNENKFLCILIGVRVEETQ